MKRGLRIAWRWTKRIVLGVIAFAVFALAVTIGALHTDWGRNRVRTEIVDALQADFPGSTITSLSGSPFGEIILRGVTLKAKDGKPLATIAELRVSAQLRPLLFKRVHVDSLALSGVEVFVREQPPAQEKPAATSAASEPSPWTIELPAISVANARVRIETTTGVEVIDGLALHAAAYIPSGAPLTASASMAGRWRGKPVTARAHASVGETIDVPFAVATFGDASVIASAVTIDGTTITGTAHGFAPAPLVTELAGKAPPSDVRFVAQARPAGAVTFAATSGSARVTGDIVANLEAITAKGVITADLPDLAVVSEGKVRGAGSLVAAVSADRDRARGIVTIAGSVDGVEATATVALDATRTEAQLVAAAAGAYQGARARAVIAASGPLVPAARMQVSGTVDVDGYRDGDTAVNQAHVAVDGTVTPERQDLVARVQAAGIRKGTTRVPAASVVADVSRTDQAITARLGPHRVKTQDGRVWTGGGGQVTITDEAFVVDDVQTGTSGSRITATARVGRLDDTLRAHVRARNVSLAMVDPTVHGTADADIDVTQQRGGWRGTASVRAHGVALPDQPTVDANVDVKLNGRTLRVDGSVENPQIGRTAVSAAVTTPRDLTNPRAWQALPRSAVDHLTLTLSNVDTAPLGGTGTVDGELGFGAADAHGTLRIRGAATKHGTVDADVTLAAGSDGTIQVHATGQTAGLPPTIADASIVLPARPFDPRAWRAHGKNALRSATIIAKSIHIDPLFLAQLGYDAPYSGDVDAEIKVAAGATSATVVANARNITGGKLTSPVDVHVRAETDSTGTRATVNATSGKLALDVDARSPLTVQAAMAGGAKTAPIEVIATVPDIAARDLLGLLGETDVLSGSVGGKVTVTGTVTAPSIRAQLAARGLALKASSVTNKKPATLDRLDVDARWNGDRIDLSIVGSEGTDRLIKIAATGNPRDPHSINGSIEAANFDLAPLAAFGTGPVRGARGTLNAALKIRGLDRQAGSIRGQLSIKDGRFPLSPELGTLRRAALTVDIINHRITATFDGRLGAGGGSINGQLTSNLVGGVPTDAHLEAKLKKVSPIGALQPQIDVDLVGNWANQDWVWNGSLAVRNGTIYVPPETGNDLLIIGAPSDMIFIDKQKLVAKKDRRLTSKPWLVTRIAIGNTKIDVDDTDFRVGLVARGELMLEVGRGYSLRGQITTTKGTLDMVGRRYRIEKGQLDFDGTTDPRLDIRMVHEFRELTLKAEIRGRASNPAPKFSGDPGAYTEGQLLSFFLGAEPGEQSSTAQQNEAVVGGGLAILSGRIGRRVNKYLPVKFDQISYEAETATSSKAIRLGRKVGEKGYLIYRQHVAPRPDENTGEAVFEYELRPDVLFEGTAGERNQGFDFLWRRRW